MALSELNGILPTNIKTTIEPKLEPERPLANFPLSIWGDMFLSFSLDNSQLEAYEKAMEQPKEQLRTLILNPAIDSNEKLSLIYSVYRLGLSYIFSEDIYSQLDKLFDKLNLQDYREADLYTTSIHFQVFRNFGYRFPSDVFNNFKDCSSGEFKEDITTDARGLISFYESAQLRIRGESILDEADVFTQTHLKTLVKTLHGTLERQVKHVLERPFNRGLEMVEARKYLVNFEKESSRYDSLLTLAKVHFNYLQLLQKEELRIISKWWKDLGMPTYVRDRAPEIYVWILALYLEPCYSQARIIATKVLLLVVVLDDTYDAYATIEEMRLLTNAINRWDITAVSQLPEYVRPFYEIILNEYAEFHKQLPEHETRDLIIDASKRAFQDLARAYHQEAEWRHSGEVPLYEEYMKTGLITSAHGAISIAALVGMGKILTQEAFAWYDSYPDMEKTSQLIGRLGDDIMSVEFERERGPIVTSVETYMKTFGVSQNVAMEALKNIVDDAWKDINEGCLKPTVVSMGVLAPLVNLTRMIDVGYRYNDGFTFPEKTLKEYIILLFCVPVANSLCNMQVDYGGRSLMHMRVWLKEDSIS